MEAGGSVTFGAYTIRIGRSFPELLDLYRGHAILAEHFDHDADVGGQCFVAAERGPSEWPQLVVTQRFAPSGAGFEPGVLVVPESGTIFLGAGDRLLAYAVRGDEWSRLWIDAADMGFYRWSRHDDVVVMSAELELAAWSLTAEKLWSTFVEPPWTYSVDEGRVRLDVMGTVSDFALGAGPAPRATA